MLRSATKAGSSASSELTLRAFSTWLNTHHVPKSTAAEILDTLQPSGPSSSLTTRRAVSTRASRLKEAEKQAEFEALPRYIRRQGLQQQDGAAGASSSRRPGGPSAREASSTKKPVEYRSKHLGPSNPATDKSEMRLLEPHTLSGRLKKLCDADKLDDAIVMLKNSPLDSQNTQVWNTLILEVLKAQRYKLAYELYIDMKRRGFSPTTRTFQTFFTGLARIDDWSRHTKVLANARTLYQNYQRLVQSIKQHDPHDPELVSAAVAGYIRLLGKAGQYQELFDVYYSLDKTGLLAPTKLTYTAMLQAMVAAQGDTVEGSVKVAADARLVWTQMIKASQRDPKAVPDSHTVAAVITALAGGNKMDYELALKIIKEYFGLQADKSPSEPGKFVLEPLALNHILRFCNRSKQYELCTNIFHQMKKRSPDIGDATILDRLHMEEILKAEIAQGVTTGLGYFAVDTLEWMLRQEITAANGPKIRPAVSTYHLVFQACWRAGDWNSAMRTFDLMTGYHAHDFKDGVVAEEPRFDKRGPGKNLEVNAEIMSYILRTALVSKNRADIRQGLRIVHHLGFEHLLRARTQGGAHHETMKVAKHRALFAKKLASVIVDSVDYLMADDGKYVRIAEAIRFVKMRENAKEYVSASGARHTKSATEEPTAEKEEGEERFTAKGRSAKRERRSVNRSADGEREARKPRERAERPRRQRSSSRTSEDDLS